MKRKIFLEIFVVIVIIFCIHFVEKTKEEMQDDISTGVDNLINNYDQFDYKKNGGKFIKGFSIVNPALNQYLVDDFYIEVQTLASADYVRYDKDNKYDENMARAKGNGINTSALFNSEVIRGDNNKVLGLKFSQRK